MVEKPGPSDKKEENKITANEMKSTRQTTGYTKWDHRKNEEMSNMKSIWNR